MSWLLLGAELPMFPATLRAASAAVPRVRGIGTQVLQCRLQKRSPRVVRIMFTAIYKALVSSLQ